MLKKETYKVIKRTILVIAVLTVIISISTATLMAQEKNAPAGNGQQNSPFLITSNLPHLTKMVKQHWDNPALHLSEEQKTKLLVVRQETLAAVGKLIKEITPLEKQVTEGIFAGKPPDELHSLVQTIGSLKVKATMIHLRCIEDTARILDQEQMDVLRK